MCTRHYRQQLAESKVTLSQALDVPAAPTGITATRTELRISRRLSVAEWEDLVNRLVYVRTGSRRRWNRWMLFILRARFWRDVRFDDLAFATHDQELAQAATAAGSTILS